MDKAALKERLETLNDKVRTVMEATYNLGLVNGGTSGVIMTNAGVIDAKEASAKQKEAVEDFVNCFNSFTDFVGEPVKDTEVK